MDYNDLVEAIASDLLNEWNTNLIADILLESTPESRAKASAYWADRKARDVRRAALHKEIRARIDADPKLKAQEDKIKADIATYRAANKPTVDTSGEW